jgi:hypothetical protein
VRCAAVGLAVLIVVSCGGSVPAMRITRFSAMPENHYPAFDRSIADATAARRVFDAVNALPPAPRGRSCPAAFGLSYRLSFNEAARVSLSVVIEGDGCAEVVFTQTDRRATDDAFWTLLADAVGVNKTDMYLVKPDGMRP